MRKSLRNALCLITVLAVLISLFTTAFATDGASNLPFADIDGVVESQTVQYVYEHGLMCGTSSTTFSPDELLTRGQFCTILWRAAGSPDSGPSTFTDVKGDAWYATAVVWASKNAIVETYNTANGVGNGTFGPDDFITREQFVQGLYNYERRVKGVSAVSVEELTYPDSDQISEYAVSAMAYLAAAGVIQPREDGRIDPRGTVTRIEAASMLQRYDNMEQIYYRHPLYQVADILKAGLNAMNFTLIDNGVGLEVESSDTTFATWEEPESLYGWQDTPVALKEHNLSLRSRLLPACLDEVDGDSALRIAAFGRVFTGISSDSYMRTQIEGLVSQENMDTQQAVLAFWNQYVQQITQGGTATLTSVGNESYQISIRIPGATQTYVLGHTGPASEAAVKLAKIDKDKYDSWVFILDVEQLAVQIFGLDDVSELYSTDVNFLKQFISNAPANGTSANGISKEYFTIDAMRKLGYLEVTGDTIYDDGAYLRMNMIQESWDSNNAGIQLAAPIGDRTGLRTVMVPSLEEALGENYAAGEDTVKIFEVGHIYTSQEGQDLPYERVSLCMMAYGPGVTMKSFTADVEAYLDMMGMTERIYTTTDIAIAYVIGDCTIPLSPTDYSTPGNFGPISKIACENYGIGAQGYMGSFEIVYFADDADVIGQELFSGEIPTLNDLISNNSIR